MGSKQENSQLKGSTGGQQAGEFPITRVNRVGQEAEDSQLQGSTGGQQAEEFPFTKVNRWAAANIGILFTRGAKGGQQEGITSHNRQEVGISRGTPNYTYTEKKFRKACYQVGFCTEDISTLAIQVL